MSLMELIIRIARKADPDLLRSIEARDGFKYPYKKQKEDFQSKGVGSRLMEHFEIEAREWGYERIIINVYENNQRAIEFYERKGYDFWFRIPYRYEEGIDAVVLYKDIGPMFVERKSKKQ